MTDNSLIDVSAKHLMLGYKPLLIGIYLNNSLRESNFLTNNCSELVLGMSKDNIIANLILEVARKEELGAGTLIIFKGKEGVHKFTPSFQKLLKNFHYIITADKKKNIFLEGNLHDQVKIAYSVPRIIYLVSLGQKGYYNIFPTDISGKIKDEYFLISLRTNGKANSQLQSIGKCVVAEMHSDSYNHLYKLGRNHMNDMQEISSFNIELNTFRSKNLNLLLPKDGIKYYELKSMDKKIEIGLHTIHFFKIINSEKLSDKNSTLAHIHRDYAEWRLKNKIQTNFLFRRLKS